MVRTPIALMVEAMFLSHASQDAIVRAIEVAEIDDQEPGDALVATWVRRKGTRLPDNWRPSESCVAYAIKHRLTRERIEIEAEKFTNYWTAKTGAGATKRDWEATWRNWILTTLERGHGFASNTRAPIGENSTPRRTPTGANAVIAGMGRLARRIVEERAATGPGDRQVQDRTDVTPQLNFKPDGT